MKADHHNETEPLACCPVCGADGNAWKTIQGTVEQEFRGETFHIPASVHTCANCHFEALQDAAQEAVVQATWAAWRKRHGLLEAREIIRFRNGLGMSQNAFADFLGVGVASVKRWEKGLVQDKAMDELIRAKMALHRLNLPTFPQFDLTERRFTQTFEMSLPQTFSPQLPAFSVSDTGCYRLRASTGSFAGKNPSPHLTLPTDAIFSAA